MRAMVRRVVSVLPVLSGVSVVRRLHGGRWERWYLDCVHSEVWIRPGELAPSIARGTPTVEVWP